MSTDERFAHWMSQHFTGPGIFTVTMWVLMIGLLIDVVVTAIGFIRYRGDYHVSRRSNGMAFVYWCKLILPVVSLLFYRLGTDEVVWVLVLLVWYIIRLRIYLTDRTRQYTIPRFVIALLCFVGEFLVIEHIWGLASQVY